MTLRQSQAFFEKRFSTPRQVAWKPEGINMGFDGYAPHENHGKNLGKPALSLASDLARLFARRVYQETFDSQGLTGCHCPSWQPKKLGKKKEARGFWALNRAASMGCSADKKGA